MTNLSSMTGVLLFSARFCVPANQKTLPSMPTALVNESHLVKVMQGKVARARLGTWITTLVSAQPLYSIKHGIVESVDNLKHSTFNIWKMARHRGVTVWQACLSINKQTKIQPKSSKKTESEIKMSLLTDSDKGCVLISVKLKMLLLFQACPLESVTTVFKQRCLYKSK